MSAVDHTHICCLTRTLANAVPHGCHASATAQRPPRCRPGPRDMLCDRGPGSLVVQTQEHADSCSPDAPLCSQLLREPAVHPEPGGWGFCGPLAMDGPLLHFINPHVPHIC